MLTITGRTFRARRALLIAVGVGGLIAAGLAVSRAQDSDSHVDSRKEERLSEGERVAKQLLLLMDKDKNGKVSKQEFMGFMEAEFARLDVNHDGELDVKELTQSRMQVRTHGR
jgi:Ca2+-binding EF-hand superfamily protein